MSRTEKDWAHLTCINYIDSIWFSDDERDSVQGHFSQGALDLIFDHQSAMLASTTAKQAASSHLKVEKVCSICKQSERIYALIRCDCANCVDPYFHVRCAIAEGLIDDWQLMDLRKMRVYCRKHFGQHDRNAEVQF